MNLEDSIKNINIIEFNKELMKKVPVETKGEAFEYIQEVYQSLPSCGTLMGEEYRKGMQDKMQTIKEKFNKKYGGR